MRFLFGDSTESSLEVNYLAFLRDAIDAGVGLLVADAGLATAQQAHDARTQATEETVRAIEELGRATLRRVEPLVDGEAPIHRCAAAIVLAVGEVIEREVGRARSGVAADLQLREDAMTPHRRQAAAALGALIAQHDLPDAEETITVAWEGAAYAARLRQRAGFGLVVSAALDVPSESLFAHDLRVDKIVDGLELHMPEAAGWVKKIIKVIPHKMGRHHVAEVTSAKEGVAVRLRASHEPGAAGVDVTVGETGAVTLVRVGSGAEPELELDERDLPGLRALAARLEEALKALRSGRRAMLDASLDGRSLTELMTLRPLVERLVGHMAPVVTQIAKHSQAPHELVLRLLLGDNRREEIFLPRSELIAKLAPLPAEARQVFAPLGLVDEEPAAAAPAAAAPAAPAPEEQGEAIEIEAELPPAADPAPVRRPLPSIFAPRSVVVDAAVAAIDRIFDELDDGDGSDVVTSAPHPPPVAPSETT